MEVLDLTSGPSPLTEVGRGQKKENRLQSTFGKDPLLEVYMAKRVKVTKHEPGLVKVVDPLVDAPADVNGSSQVPPVSPNTPIGPSPRPSIGQRVRRFFEFLVRLVAWLIILGVIGLGLYYGLPLLYQKYVVPVEQNTAGVTELQSRQEQTEQELADFQARLESIEAEQNQNSESLTALDQRVSESETEITARTESLAVLERMQAELQDQNEAASAELERQVNLLKAMELLSRARLFLYQSNFGLAEQDVQIARNLLASTQSDAPGPLAEDLDTVVFHLDLTLSNLPNFPVAASDDLDIAWQILLSGSPPTQTSVGVTATLVITPSPASTASTATSQATVSPTPTP
jgi:hypothetical protein